MSKRGWKGLWRSLPAGVALGWAGSVVADVTRLQDVFINNTLFTPTTGDLIVGDTALVDLGPASTLIVNNGSDLVAGTINAGGGTLVVPVSVLLDGAGSRIVLGASGLRYGSGMSSALAVTGGAVLDAGNVASCSIGCGIKIGEFAGGSASLVVSGTGSRVISIRDFAVGEAFTEIATSIVGTSTGTVNVQAGGRIDAERALIGAGALNDPNFVSSSVGVLGIDGTGSLFNAGEMLIGAGPRSQGSVTVSNGGQLAVAGGLDMSVTADATSLLDINGPSSRASARSVVIGVQGDAMVNVTAGGEFSVQQLLRIGDSNSENDGVLVVDGTGSVVKAGDDLIIGSGTLGNGLATVQNQGRLDVGGQADVNGNGTFAVIGAPGGSGEARLINGVFEIDSQGVTNSARLHVGDGGIGTLDLAAGSSLSIISPATGTVLSGLRIGNGSGTQSGDGSMTVDASTVLLRGPGMSLDIAETGPGASAGTTATGNLDIVNGALVQLDGQGGLAQVRLGNGAGADGAMIIDNGRLEVTGAQASVFIGHDGNGVAGDGLADVTVRNGGVLSVNAGSATNGNVFVGRGAGQGTLIVEAGGTVITSGTVFVSSASANNATQTGLVSIQAGGALDAAGITVGAGGTLTNAGTLTAQRLQLFAGAAVSMPDYNGIDTLLLDGFMFGAGTLSLGRAAGQRVELLNGGRIDLTGPLDLAAAAGSRVQVIVGPGSVVASATDVDFGNTAATGSLIDLAPNARLSAGARLLLRGSGNSVNALAAGSRVDASVIVLDGAALNFGTAQNVSALTRISLGSGAVLSGRSSPVTPLLEAAGNSRISVPDLSAVSAVFLDASQLESPAPILSLGATGGAVQNLTAVNGSRIQASELRIGTDPGSRAAVTVDGSTVAVAGSGSVGGSGLVSQLVLGGGSTATFTNRLQVNAGGSVQLTGAGTVVNTALLDLAGGALSFVAGTTVDAGTIQVGAGSVLSGTGLLNAAQIVVMTGGVLDAAIDAVAAVAVNGGELRTVNAPLYLGVSTSQVLTVGAGGRLVDGRTTGFAIGSTTGGSGQLVLTGASTFSAAGSGAVRGNGSRLDVAAGSGTAVAGDLTLGAGTRSLINGPLSSLSVAGNLTLDGGRLELVAGGSARAANVGVLGNGVLAGTGTITTGVVRLGSGALLAPGNSPGTLNVVGDVVLDGGRMLFEIGGAGPGQFDVLDVTGSLDLLAGAIELVPFNGFQPQTGDTFDIFRVTGATRVDPGVALSFSDLGPDFEIIFADRGAVNVGTLRFLAIDIQELVGLTENQLELASYFDDVCPRVERLVAPTAAEADLDSVCGSLRSSRNTAEQIGSALEAIAPDEVLGIIDSLLRFTTVQHGSLAQRLNGLRSGASRISVSGLDIVTDNVRLAGRDLQRLFEGLTGGSAGEGEDFGRWGFFADGNFHFGDKAAGVHESGFDFETVNLTLGTDYRVTDSLFLGVALGYNEVKGDFDAGGGMRVRGTSATLMGSWFEGDRFYLDVLATYGWTEADTSRHIRYTVHSGELVRRASGSTDGGQFVMSAGSGLDFNVGAWTLGPHAGASYSELELADFNETGANGLNLAIPDQLTRSLTGNAGMHLSRIWTPAWGVLVPYVRFDLVREFRDEGQQSDVTLMADRFRADPLDPSRPARLQTDGADRNYWTWSAGLHAQLVHGIAAFFSYRGMEGLRGFDLGEVSVGLRYEKAF